MEIETSFGKLTMSEYDDVIAKGLRVCLNGEIICLIDAYADKSELRAIIYALGTDEPTECIKIA